MSAWAAIAEGKMLTGRPIQGKTIANVRKVQEMEIHFPARMTGQLVDSRGRTLEVSHLRQLTFAAEFVPDYDSLLINHYWSRSEKSLADKFAKPGAGRVMRASKGRRADIVQASRWSAAISTGLDRRLAHRVRARSFPYIFVTGFNKTATRAIASFFTKNGLPSVHWDQNLLVEKMLANLAAGENVFHGYDDRYRVFTDLILSTEAERVEGNQYFAEMDRDYPGSFFILNNRNTDDWITSRSRHGNGEFLRREMRRMSLENPAEVQRLWRTEKEAHEAKVRKYFEGRHDFIELDISSENIPIRLGRFLALEFDCDAWEEIGITPAPT